MALKGSWISNLAPQLFGSKALHLERGVSPSESALRYPAGFFALSLESYLYSEFSMEGICMHTLMSQRTLPKGPYAQ